MSASPSDAAPRAAAAPDAPTLTTQPGRSPPPGITGRSAGSTGTRSSLVGPPAGADPTSTLTGPMSNMSSTKVKPLTRPRAAVSTPTPQPTLTTASASASASLAAGAGTAPGGR